MTLTLLTYCVLKNKQFVQIVHRVFKADDYFWLNNKYTLKRACCSMQRRVNRYSHFKKRTRSACNFANQLPFLSLVPLSMRTCFTIAPNAGEISRTKSDT
ncbi:hypothetical protein CW304_04710 [Bacillus sp. UFRGS-B20]|nr:hypothetical protein CW304_04710 [Bacillus sp. UFRGS-B20]